MKYLIILSFLLFGCAKNDIQYYDPNINCNCLDEPNANDKFQYLNSPPSKKWDSLFNIGGYDYAYEKILQVPISEASKMSTLGLLQSVLENPTIHSTFIVSNSWFLGRTKYLKSLYASWELNKRTDAVKIFMDFYSKKPPCCVNKISQSDSVKLISFIYNKREFEIIACQDSILNKFRNEESQQFIRTVIDQYFIQDQYPQFGKDRTTTLLLMSNIMFFANYKPFVDEMNNNVTIKNFVLGSILSNESLSEKILLHARRFAVS